MIHSEFWKVVKQLVVCIGSDAARTSVPIHSLSLVIKS